MDQLPRKSPFDRAIACTFERYTRALWLWARNHGRTPSHPAELCSFCLFVPVEIKVSRVWLMTFGHQPLSMHTCVKTCDDGHTVTDTFIFSSLKMCNCFVQTSNRWLHPCPANYMSGSPGSVSNIVYASSRFIYAWTANDSRCGCSTDSFSYKLTWFTVQLEMNTLGNVKYTLISLFFHN